MSSTDFGAIERPVLLSWQQYPASDSACPLACRDVAFELEGAGLDTEAVLGARIMIGELFSNAVSLPAAWRGELVDVAVYRMEGSQGPWFGVGTTIGGRGPRTGKGAARRLADERRALEVVRGLGARVLDLRLVDGYRVIAWFPEAQSARTRVCNCPCMSSRDPEWWICRWTVPMENVAETAGNLCLACRTHMRGRSM